MTDADRETVENRWQERLAEARIGISHGIDPDVLADRYDVETVAEIEALTKRATREALGNSHSTLTLDDLDAAAQCLADDSDQTVASVGECKRSPVDTTPESDPRRKRGESQ